jgi:hypothetical protein
MTPIEKAILLVAQYFNNRLHHSEPANKALSTEDVYVVWFCYILGGWKALVSTTVPDNMYYEVTYDKEKRKTYIDAYKKFDNVFVPDDGDSHTDYRDAGTGRFVTDEYAVAHPDTTVAEKD